MRERLSAEIRVVVVIILEYCHHLVVSYNGFSQGFDTTIFVNDNACRRADSVEILTNTGIILHGTGQYMSVPDQYKPLPD